MELIVAVLVPFPLGFFVRNRMAAYLAYVAVYSFTFTYQTMELLREWVRGDDAAFPRDAASPAWQYALVNLVIYAAGIGLVTLGHTVRNRRRRKTAQTVDLAS